MDNKKISVIMGIYNCANTLEEAVESIQNQTYENWELIMCDDGSKDHTYQLAKELQKNDNRIIVIRNKENRGLNYTLNRCLKKASGAYIARMDGDDVCSPNRFEVELQILMEEEEIDFVSTNMAFYDESGIWGETHTKEYPEKEDFLGGSPFCHAPCLVKKEAYMAVGGYTVNKRLLRVEDYHLWLKMYCMGYKGKNIQETLYQMRDDRNAYARRKFKYRLNEAYVKILVVKKFHLPIYNYIFVCRPIIVGLMPKKIYDLLHKLNLKR